MPADRFLDTIILLYAYDLYAPTKRAVAREILEEAWLRPCGTALSVQVLQEFHVNFVRSGHPVAEATLIVGDFTSFGLKIRWPSFSEDYCFSPGGKFRSGMP